MKKILPLLLLLFVVTLSGCSSKPQTSEQATSVGKSVIAAVDSYLDNNASSSATISRLDELSKKLDYLDTEDKAEGHSGLPHSGRENAVHACTKFLLYFIGHRG